MNIFQKIICIIRFKLLKHKLSKFGEVHYINGSETLPAPLKKNEEELVMKKATLSDCFSSRTVCFNLLPPSTTNNINYPLC
jgi:hypothetical protein